MRSGRILFILLVLVLLPYLYLAGFAHPAGDDYSYAVESLQKGLIPGAAEHYLMWNGRYASNLLVFGNPISWGGTCWYQAIVVLLLAATATAYGAFYHEVFRDSLSRLAKTNLSLFSLAIYLFNTPSIAEGVYWYTGAVTYQAAHVLFLLYAALLLAYFRGHFLAGRIIHLSLATLLLVAVVGFNETIMLLMVGFHAIGLSKSLAARSRAAGTWTYFTGVAVAAAAAVFLAPGNAVRAAHSPAPHELIRSVVFSSFQSLRFFFAWISTAPVLLGSVLFFFLIRRTLRRNALVGDAFYLTPREALLLVPVVLIACTFPPYWATGVLGQHRTLNTGYFFFLVVGMVNIGSWARYFHRRPFPISVDRRFVAILMLLAVSSMAFTQNGYWAALDLVFGAAHAYDRQNREREKIIERAVAENRRFVVVPPLTARPRSLFKLDLAPHWGDPTNQAVGRYYGIAIAVSSETGRK